MSLNRKNGAKLAGVVLSGALAFTGAVPAAAEQAAEPVQETAAHSEKEQKERIVFLNTEDSGNNPEISAGKAVRSFEEAVSLLSGGETPEPMKLQSGEEEKKILVLLGDTVLSAEENRILEEKGISCMTEEEYRKTQEADSEDPEKETAAEAPEAEEEKENPDPEPEEDSPLFVLPAPENSGEQDAGPFIWEAPKIILSAAEDNSPVSAAEKADAEDSASGSTEEAGAPAETDAAAETGAAEKKPSETAGILLPGFSLPSGIGSENTAGEESGEQTGEKTGEKIDDAGETEDALPEAAAETPDGDSSSAAEQSDEQSGRASDSEETGDPAGEAEEEEIQGEAEEEVVYTLFSLFETGEIASAEEDPVSYLEASMAVKAEGPSETESADAGDTNELVKTEAEEEVTEAVLFSLPGRDLVGRGTSGVGGGSSSSGSGSSGSGSSGRSSRGNASTGSGSKGSSSSGSGSNGNASAGSGSGSSAQNASSGSAASGAGTSGSAPAAVSQGASASGKGYVQTGDTSARPFWGLTAGISGAMAAYLAAQWRKFRRE